MLQSSLSRCKQRGCLLLKSRRLSMKPCYPIIWSSFSSPEAMSRSPLPAMEKFAVTGRSLYAPALVLRSPQAPPLGGRVCRIWGGSQRDDRVRVRRTPKEACSGTSGIHIMVWIDRCFAPACCFFCFGAVKRTVKMPASAPFAKNLLRVFHIGWRALLSDSIKKYGIYYFTIYTDCKR